MTTNPVDRFLDAVAAGTGVPTDLYRDDALLDATVPQWRLEQHGPAAIAAQLSSWFADPATLSEVVRTPVPGGEIVRFSLAWLEDGQPWAAHQVHLVDLVDGRIARQDVWCGGRWPAALQAEIESGLQAARGQR